MLPCVTVREVGCFIIVTSGFAVSAGVGVAIGFGVEVGFGVAVWVGVAVGCGVAAFVGLMSKKFTVYSSSASFPSFVSLYRS